MDKLIEALNALAVIGWTTESVLKMTVEQLLAMAGKPIGPNQWLETKIVELKEPTKIRSLRAAQAERVARNEFEHKWFKIPFVENMDGTKQSPAALVPLLVFLPNGGGALGVLDGRIDYREENNTDQGLTMTSLWFDGIATLDDVGIRRGNFAALVCGKDQRGKWCIGPVKAQFVSNDGRSFRFRNQGRFAVVDDAGMQNELLRQKEKFYQEVRYLEAKAVCESRPAESFEQACERQGVKPISKISWSTCSSKDEVTTDFGEPAPIEQGGRKSPTDEEVVVRMDSFFKEHVLPVCLEAFPASPCPKCGNGLDAWKMVRWQGSTVKVCGKCAAGLGQ